MDVKKDDQRTWAGLITVLLLIVIFTILTVKIFSSTESIISFCSEFYKDPEKYNMVDFYESKGDDSFLPAQCVKYIETEDVGLGIIKGNYEKFDACLSETATPEQIKAMGCHWMGRDYLALLLRVFAVVFTTYLYGIILWIYIIPLFRKKEGGK